MSEKAEVLKIYEAIKKESSAETARIVAIIYLICLLHLGKFWSPTEVEEFLEKLK